MRVAIPAEVVSFDEATKTATIRPLIKETDEEPAVVQGVPLLGFKFKDGDAVKGSTIFVEPGDVVLVVCADREIKNALTGRAAKPDTSRMHSLNDAVIVGVFGCSL